MSDGAKLYTEMSEGKVTTSMGEHRVIGFGESFLPAGGTLATRLEPHWYAIYTSANHERRVAQQLAVRGIDHFLPQYESIRRWKDRKVRLERPLFPGYVFVHLVLQNRLPVLQVPGVARFVGFDGLPTAVPEEDLGRVREFLGHGFHAEPHPFIKAGLRVRVKSGPLAGMEGIVVRRKNGRWFVISFELIQRAMAVEVADEDLEPL